MNGGKGLRILVVNWQDRMNPHAGGAEIHLHEIFGRLVERGHAVTLLASGWPGSAPRALVDGIDVHRAGGRYTFPLHARRAFGRLEPAAFDVIVEDVNKLPLLTPRWSKTPVVCLVPHLFGSTAFAQEPWPVAATVWLAERVMPAVYRRTPVVVISESTADDLAARGFERERITVSHPGVDHAVCTPPAGGPGAERAAEPTLVYVGRLKRYKSVDVVLRAIARLARERPAEPVHLVVAGRGDDAGRLEEIAVELGIEALVEFRGYVSEVEKVSLLRRAWANVYPSPKEGWGITNIEAAACGTPSLASDAPGLRESVVDGETGWLVPYGEVDAWADAIAGLATRPERVEEMGAAALQFATQFTWEDTTRRIESVLYSAAATREGR
ncbi:MAG TPA: glycosyltransferase family 4 protein [Gemmatimonadota bacterium]|nr:glycosyltransferase family 4 protein [Gemmatimonadota bacterium]